MAFRYAKLSFFRNLLITGLKIIYRHVFQMDIHPSCNFSLSAKFDKTNPRGVHVDQYCYIAFDAAILTHDLTRGVRLHTRIGKNCFIGARSIILPGISIGDGAIVGAGAVVTRDVPANTIVAGNPARIIRENIETGPYGRLKGADATQRLHTSMNNLD